MGGAGTSISSSATSSARGEQGSIGGAAFGDFNVGKGAGSGLKPLTIAILAAAVLAVLWIIKRA
jgi:hypothetical protein